MSALCDLTPALVRVKLKVSVEKALELRQHMPATPHGKVVWYVAALLCLAAALAHLAVAPAHLTHSTAHGIYLLSLGLAQGLYALWLLLRPQPLVLALGIGGTAASLLLYLLSRTGSVPFLDALAGHGEGVAAGGLAVKAIEIGLLLPLIQLWRESGASTSNHAAVQV